MIVGWIIPELVDYIHKHNDHKQSEINPQYVFIISNQIKNAVNKNCESNLCDGIIIIMDMMEKHKFGPLVVLHSDFASIVKGILAELM